MLEAAERLRVVLKDYFDLTGVLMYTGPSDRPLLDRVVWTEGPQMNHTLQNLEYREDRLQHLQQIHANGGRIRNNEADDPGGSPFFLRMFGQVVTYMSVALTLDERTYGAVIMYSKVYNQYSTADFDTLTVIRKPLAVMMHSISLKREMSKQEQSRAPGGRASGGRLQLSQRIIGMGGGLKQVISQAKNAAETNIKIHITGETGTGKEVIARFIHESSSRKQGPFLAINCGALPRNIIDSELFGHEKGAFTGAQERRMGCFELASKGTLFLDEVAELPLKDQVRLLRVLQSNEVKRVGGDKPIPVDVRVITATNQNLFQMVQEGSFREDLFYRINVFAIRIPPLRERKEDIPELIKYYLAKYVREQNLDFLPQITDQQMKKLQACDWPGNVRELQNWVEHALLQIRMDNSIGLEGFLPGLTAAASPGKNARQPGTQAPLLDGSGQRWLTLDEVNVEHIQKVLAHTHGKIHGDSGAAAILGINPSTLRTRMKKYGIPFGKGGR